MCHNCRNNVILMTRDVIATIHDAIGAKQGMDHVGGGEILIDDHLSTQTGKLVGPVAAHQDNVIKAGRGQDG